jgi:hypothetical protein
MKNEATTRAFGAIGTVDAFVRAVPARPPPANKPLALLGLGRGSSHEEPCLSSWHEHCLVGLV